MARTLVDGLPDRGPVLEIGAGDGQFTAVLRPLLQDRLVITEPTEEGVQRLRRRFPGADIRRAPAEAPPLDGLAGVVGCCILDVLTDLPRALATLSGALRPGGVLGHVLDMTTDLRGLMQEVLAEGTTLVVPNVWFQGTEEEWPEDLLLVHREDMGTVCRLGGGEELERLLAAESTAELTAAFDAVHGSAEARRRFKQSFARALAAVSPAERDQIARFRGQAISSGRLFADRLQRALPPSLTAVQSELVRHRQSDPSGRWRRCVLGFVQEGRGPRGEVGRIELGAHLFRAVRQPMSMSSSGELP